jgi:hypothetical protein
MTSGVRETPCGESQARAGLVHWTGETDYPQTGDGAVTKLWRDLEDILTVSLDERQPAYRLDLWRRP